MHYKHYNFIMLTVVRLAVIGLAESGARLGKLVENRFPSSSTLYNCTVHRYMSNTAWLVRGVCVYSVVSTGTGAGVGN